MEEIKESLSLDPPLRNLIGPFDHRSRRRNRVTYGKVVREEKRKNTLNTKWKVLIVLLRRIQRRAVYSAKVSEFSIKRYTIEDGSNRDSSIESSIRVDQGGRKEGNWARIKRYVSEDLWNPSSRAKRIIQKRIERKQGRNVSTYFESMIRPNAFSRDIHAQGYVVICKTRSKEVSFFLSISFPEDDTVDEFVSFRKSLIIKHWKNVNWFYWSLLWKIHLI